MKFKVGDIVEHISVPGKGRIIDTSPGNLSKKMITVKWEDAPEPSSHPVKNIRLIIEPNDLLKEIL